MVELTYPNLSGCKMSIANASGMSKPPVRLPDGCKEAGEMKLPPVYDFELGGLPFSSILVLVGAVFNKDVIAYCFLIRLLTPFASCILLSVALLSNPLQHVIVTCRCAETEKAVLTKKKQREDALSGKSNTRESLQRSSITKMKSVTGADETLCVAMLEENGYDLKQSIEAFFSKN